MELRDYATLFLRRKWLIAFSFLFILLAGSVYCVVAPERYKSSTTILVVPQSVPEDYVRSTVSVKVNQQLATIKQQVLSRTTLTKVMDELALFPKERERMSPEDVVEMMRKRIEIEVYQTKGRDGSLEAFTLSFLHPNPRMAMLAASRLATFFIDENLKTRELQAVGTSEFLESQLKETKERLEAQEAKVKEYKTQFMGQLPDQMEANLRMLTGLQDRFRANEAAVRAQEDRKVYLEAQLQTMERSMAAVATENGSSVAVYREDPAQALAAKRARLEEMSARYTPQHPSVAALREEIAVLENRVAASGKAAAGNPDGKPPLIALPKNAPEEYHRMRAQLQSATAELSSLRRERTAIQAAVASVEGKIQAAPHREQEMVSLVRDYENLKKSYDDLLAKKLEADVSQNLEKRQKGTQFQILDPANLPESPFTPDRKKVMGIALALALGLGFGGALFIETVDQSLRDVPDFRHLYKVPVLGVISQVQDRKAARARQLRRKAVLAGLMTFAVALSAFLLLFGQRIRQIVGF